MLESSSSSSFEERLRREGRARYHDRHPFHQRMHEGLLTPDELRIWVENRYYYQSRLPIKDALVVAKSEDRAFRRLWAERIAEQDGPSDDGPDEAKRRRGGLELWLALAEGVGLDRARVERFEGVLPGVRRACDRYVAFVREATLLEAVASSLTECFAPDLMARRIAAWSTHYTWIPERATAYFGARVVRAQKDSEHGLAFVLEHATSPELKNAALRALVTKCEILWSMLDAIDEVAQHSAKLGRMA